MSSLRSLGFAVGMTGIVLSVLIPEARAAGQQAAEARKAVDPQRSSMSAGEKGDIRTDDQGEKKQGDRVDDMDGVKEEAPPRRVPGMKGHVCSH